MPKIKNSYDVIVDTKDAKTPSVLKFPTFFMCAPFEDSNSTEVANNVWMKQLPPEERQINYDLAFQQWMGLYSYLAANAMVYIIPSAGDLQDQVYVANAGMYVESKDIYLLANYTSPPREGEEQVTKMLMDMMKYKVQQPPAHWEGEADLKYIRDNIYVGGYGIRSQIEAYEWMEKQFDLNIIKVKMVDEKLYHFDCQFFPLTNQKALVCTKIITPKEVKEIEKVCEIIDVSVEDAHAGITNCVRVRDQIMVMSNVTKLQATDKEYLPEAIKVERLNAICAQNGLGLVVFNLSEFNKGGAALSCCICHLNYVDYQSEVL
jgi:N-dimethylarginine dimethylaminohydrolase